MWDVLTEFSPFPEGIFIRIKIPIKSIVVCSELEKHS